METQIYNIQGKAVGKIDLPENLFGLKWNADLVHQVVTSMRGNARSNVAHTKDRGEVRGGGKKPWQQKGTGRARHGSSRSPIWKGGGVTHGPRNAKVYARTIPQKMRQKALLVALSRKAKDGELILIDSLSIAEPKAKTARAFVQAISKKFVMKNKNAALIALPTTHKPTMKSFGNFGNVEVVDIHNLNPVSVLGKKYLMLAEPQLAIEVLSKKASAK